MQFFRTLWKPVLMSMFCFDSLTALGQTVSQTYGDSLTKQTQTVFVRADANFTTYQSDVADSNTTATTSSVSAGGFAGENRALGVFVTHNDQRIEFAEDKGTISNNWNDLRLQARFKWFYPSVVISVSEIQFEQGGVKLADMYGTGVGAGFGLFGPVTENIVMHADAYAISAQNTKNNIESDAKIGDRVEAEAGVSIDVLKHYVDFLLGYKVRRYSMTIGEEKYNEVQSSPYTGLQLGMYF